MKENVIGILLALLLLSLTGCGGGNVMEAEKETEIQNGDRITRKLTEKAVLDAKIELPEGWNGTVESCRVKNVNFNGEELSGKLYPDIPAKEWKNANVGESDEPEELYYEGDIWIEEGQQPEPGMIYLGTEFRINTARVERNRSLFQQNIRPDSYAPREEMGEELAFMSAEAAKERAEQYWRKVVGLEGVRFLGYYPVSHEELFKEAEDQAQGRGETVTEEYGEKDDCYDIRMELMVNGLPLTAEYSRNGRKDGLYVPSGELVTIVGADGIKYVSCNGNYEILETNENKAASMEKVYEALERKFKMMMAGDIVIHEMRLVYYPFPLSSDQELQEYEFIPAWCFTFSYDGIPSHVYVNAVTGEEIAE